jgi:N-acetylglucosamine-6-phosphate deacetylase
MTAELTGSVLTSDGWMDGAVIFDERVVAVAGDPINSPTPPYVLPGFVDLHVHGGGGHDVMAGETAIRKAAELHAQHGTTTLLATSVTAPPEAIGSFLADAVSVMAAPGAGEARVAGAHLEGPFINPRKLGAQPPFARSIDLDMAATWLATGVVRIMTLAPELDGAKNLMALLQSQGARAQLGHSLCGYSQAAAALSDGCGVTHLYNAMSGLSHRDNGLAGAALAHADWAEIIPDLLHVEAGGILAARRAIPNLYGVTDATAGAGMPDGEYALGTHRAVKRGQAIRLSDGTLAGSVLTMDRALRNLVSIGLDLAEASARLSRLPADWAGVLDGGRIAPGLRADLVQLDHKLMPVEVRVAGRIISTRQDEDYVWK